MHLKEYIFLASLIITVEGSKERPVRTGLYNQVYKNGRGGQCEIFKQEALGRVLGPSLVSCKTGWVKKSTLTYPTQALSYVANCQYYKRTMTLQCYGAEGNKTGQGLETCVRELIYYYISRSCERRWLDWEECDNECGGGYMRRIKISFVPKNAALFQREIETRQCNTHKCPTWSEWTPNRVNGSVEKCDADTCTRSWRRYCMYKHNITEPSKCESGTGNAGAPVIGELTDILFRNSTHETRPCLLSECPLHETPVIQDNIDNSISSDSTTPKSNTENITTKPKDEETSINSTYVGVRTKSGRNGETSVNSSAVQVNLNSSRGNEIWIGVIIGLTVAIIIILLSCFVITRRKKAIDSHSYWPITRIMARFRPEQMNTNAAQLNNATTLTNTSTANTNSSGEYLQPTIRRYNGVGPTPIPPPPLPNGTISSTNEGTYCVVPSPMGTIDPENRPNDTNESSVYPHRPLTRQRAHRNTLSPTDDPIYSDIPAYDRMQQNQPSVRGPLSMSGLERDVYPSSEFDSSESESSTDNQISHAERIRKRLKNDKKDSGLCSRMNNDQEQDLKSCYSDEGRDVVNTLRRPSRKGRFNRLDPDEREEEKEEEDDRSNSDEDLRLLDDEFQNEMMSAYTARYSKPHLNRNKDDSNYNNYQINSAGGRRRIGSDSPPPVQARHPFPVDSEFQWIRGNSGRRPPQTYSPSAISRSSQRSRRRDSIEQRWSGNYHRRLCNRMSSGASSIASSHHDTVTSDYNSAKDLTDDDLVSWKRRSLENQRPLPSGAMSNRKIFFRTKSTPLATSLDVRPPMQPPPLNARTNSSFNPRNCSSLISSPMNQRSHVRDDCRTRGGSLVNSRTIDTERLERQLQGFRNASQTQIKPTNYNHNKVTYARSLSNNVIINEDAYNRPADATGPLVNEALYSMYNVPFNSRNRKTFEPVDT